MAATPPPHTYKVNCDAFVDKKHEWISLGIVARDYEGFVLAGPRTTRNFLFEPVVVEALAVLHAMELSKEIGFNDIILKGDALQIVKAIKATFNNWSNIGHIVEGINIGLRQMRSWRIEHVKRDANKQLIL
jgi:hypothetical protein